MPQRQLRVVRLDRRAFGCTHRKSPVARRAERGAPPRCRGFVPSGARNRLFYSMLRLAHEAIPLCAVVATHAGPELARCIVARFSELTAHAGLGRLVST